MATRARGRPSNASIDVGWPWQVEIVEPFGGVELRALGEWAHSRVPPGDHEKRPGNGGHVRHAFRTREQAEAFRATFGGEVIDATPRPKSGRAKEWRP